MQLFRNIILISSFLIIVFIRAGNYHLTEGELFVEYLPIWIFLAFWIVFSFWLADKK